MDDFLDDNTTGEEQQFDDNNNNADFGDDNFGGEEEEQEEEQPQQQSTQSFDFDDESSSSQQQEVQQQQQQGFDDEEEESNNQGYAEYQESATYVPPQIEQSTPLQEWQRQKNQVIQENDDKSDKKHKEMRSTADKYKQNLLKERSDRTSNTQKKNKEEEEVFVSTNKIDHDNVWENVLKYVDIHSTGSKKKKSVSTPKDDDLDLSDVDLTGKRKAKTETVDADTVAEDESKDTSRMKKILIQLKVLWRIKPNKRS